MTSESRSSDLFEQHRARLLVVAKGMLDSASTAEDVLQDVWIVWSRGSRDTVANPGAYLRRATVNRCIDVASSPARRHERASLDADVALVEGSRSMLQPGPESRLVEKEQLSTALWQTLRCLSSLERAVFILREAFGFEYHELAGQLHRSEPAVRQLARRARQHLRAGRPRFAVTGADHSTLLQLFHQAAGGQLAGLVDALVGPVSPVADAG